MGVIHEFKKMELLSQLKVYFKSRRLRLPQSELIYNTP